MHPFGGLRLSHGHKISDALDDEEIRLAYSGATDEETIVMAEEFSQIRQEPSPLMTWTTHPMPRQSILADR